MLAPISRAVGARAVSRVAQFQMRTFIVPTLARRADFVQDLYLKELKAYKAPPVKDTDAQGQVQTFSLPKAPKSPEEADLASSLKEYEAMAVEVEGQDAAAQAPGAAAPVLEDWLVDEEDEEPHSSHPVAGATN